MKWIACLVVVLGCQRGADAPTSDYTKDVEALCDCMSRSGADKVDPDARALTIANWLAANLKTPDARTFLVQIQPLVGDAKADALEAEARRVGLPGCALAREWRTPR